ncbi:hypothetical protein L917_08661 [Phytophthora nicotianae]|uniref:Uncharacterized protein n=1 Tax=Phytophthora nicotianae TaxID=4792 RepID=W2L6Q7_PHYNI|nr:hypothetical protein L915_08811 [Phytophthora nicotianae]ETL93103.1 hypothetical protein L917_08661 [Phytophthora nicotianae]
MKKQGLKYDVVVITIAPNYGNSAGKVATVGYVSAFTVFYDMKAKCRLWIEDRMWFEQD